MNRFTLGSMALASVLLAPAVSHAQIPCTREGLKAAADLSIAAQARGYRRLRQGPITGSAVAPGSGFLVDLPVSGRMSYVENFDTTPRSSLIGKPLKIDQHLTLLDTARCETYTEGLVSDKADPYALGTQLRVKNEVVVEIDTMWTAPGYRGFDIDGYLKNSSAEDRGTIPAARRETRATLESAANAYLDALLAGKADVMPWGFPCNRTAADGSCQVGVPAGTVNIANRRFVVDETMGAVDCAVYPQRAPCASTGGCARRRARIYFSRQLEERMGATNRLRWAAVAALSCALPLIAHHSFSAEFDSDKTLTLRGTISKVDWINPHIFVYLDVKDDAGKTTTWELQSLPPLFFRGSGLTKDVLLSNKQEVTVTANPAKDGTRAYGFMTKLSYPDGHVFSMSPLAADPSLGKTQK